LQPAATNANGRDSGAGGDVVILIGALYLIQTTTTTTTVRQLQEMSAQRAAWNAKMSACRRERAV
jgi:hypothetical protein